MEDIAKPTNINFEEGSDANEGTITIEPCYPGYGTTLGNSIRRVLLSSLPGAAVTKVKIEGATHEFTTLSHVKEDILEIILNLKKLRVKMHTEEEVKLELNAAGEKQVTAGDISKNSEVEVVNPELPIANITDMSGSLNMVIFVNPGRGYMPVESMQNSEKEAGTIDVDASFSPILSVGVNVENVRVGKMTNWDKLVLNITTDGTITPKQAFEMGVGILIDQFNSLVEGETEEKSKKETGKKEEETASPKKTTKSSQKKETQSKSTSTTKKSSSGGSSSSAKKSK